MELLAAVVEVGKVVLVFGCRSPTAPLLNKISENIGTIHICVISSIQLLCITDVSIVVFELHCVWSFLVL